jgi:hypothetical protein
MSGTEGMALHTQLRRDGADGAQGLGQGQEPGDASPRLFPLAFLLALGVALLPIATSQTRPLLDWPNHLARMHVLRDIGDSPLLQQIYDVRWRPVPNLAMDLIVPFLGRVMSLETAGRIFIGLSFLLLAGGTALVHRQLFGRFSYWPLLAFLFLYDRTFLLGLVNYLFGLGLALVAFAAWLALARHPAWLRLLVSSLASLALYLSHLFAFGVYGLAVAGFELGRIARAAGGGERRRALAGLPLAALQAVIPLLLFFRQPHDPIADHMNFGPYLRKADLLFTILDNYARLFDFACFAGLLLLFLWACQRHLVRFAPAIIGPLLALAIAYFAMPANWMTANNIDRRLPMAFVLLLLAGTQPGGFSRRAAGLVMAGLAGLFLVRIAIIERAWRAGDRFYATLAPAFEALPPGARIAVAYHYRTLHEPPSTVPIAHFALNAVRLKDAFVPTLFASPSQQPVHFMRDYEALALQAYPIQLWLEFVDHPGTAPPARIAALQQFDYMLFVDHVPFTLEAPGWLEPVFMRPSFQLYRIVKPPPP